MKTCERCKKLEDEFRFTAQATIERLMKENERLMADQPRLEAQLKSLLTKAVRCRQCGSRAVLGRCDTALESHVFTLQCGAYPGCFNFESAKSLDVALERWNECNTKRCEECGK